MERVVPGELILKQGWRTLGNTAADSWHGLRAQPSHEELSAKQLKSASEVIEHADFLGLPLGASHLPKSRNRAYVAFGMPGGRWLQFIIVYALRSILEGHNLQL